MPLPGTLRRFLSPEPKVFIIGFNKCGTRTLHFFFKANGYRSIQAKKKPWHRMSGWSFLAVAMEENIACGEHVLKGYSGYQVFSDLTYSSSTRLIEANRFFREFHHAFPDAYFIFNDRPVEKWIRSRINHVSSRSGSLLANQSAVLKLPPEAVIEYWREAYAAHKAAVCDYFAGNPRFMVFDIESDPPAKLAGKLAGDFRLDPSKWKHYGLSRTPAPAGSIVGPA